jgi:hypothetical protein
MNATNRIDSIDNNTILNLSDVNRLHKNLARREAKPVHLRFSGYATIETYIILINFMSYYKKTKRRFFSLNRLIPGRTGTVVNDRLRRETEIYGGRTHLAYTICVYGAIRSETESVHGDREKIRSH